jgi:hypothetical protein
MHITEGTYIALPHVWAFKAERFWKAVRQQCWSDVECEVLLATGCWAQTFTAWVWVNVMARRYKCLDGKGGYVEKYFEYMTWLKGTYYYSTSFKNFVTLLQGHLSVYTFTHLFHYRPTEARTFLIFNIIRPCPFLKSFPIVTHFQFLFRGLEW